MLKHNNNTATTHLINIFLPKYLQEAQLLINPPFAHQSEDNIRRQGN